MYNHGTDTPGMGYMQGYVTGALYGGAPSMVAEVWSNCLQT